MPRLLDDRFKDQGGNPLVASDAVIAEGQRIRDSLAAGTYGNQPVAAAAAERGPGGVTPTASDLDPNSSFGKSFWQQPSMWEQNLNPAQLRQDLRLDELKTRAALGKLTLERAQKEGPIKDAYALAQLEHEQAATAAVGGTTRFKQLQDAATMKHVTGFADYMANAPEVSSPDYHGYVLAGVHQFPRIAGTAWGKATLGKLAQEHDTISGLMKQLPPGMDVSSLTVGGGKQDRITVKPKAIEKSHAVTVGTPQKDGSFKGDSKGTHVKLTYSDGKTKDKILSIDEYKQLGGEFSDTTMKERAAGTKSLGRYNPKTGDFEP